MINEYSHFYLYAKTWYKETNLIEDLKKVLSNYTETDVEHLDIGHVSYMVGHIAYQHMTEANFFKLISGLNPNRNSFYQENEDYDFSLCFIKECLMILRFIDREEIKGDLASPNENILPLREIKE